MSSKFFRSADSDSDISSDDESLYSEGEQQMQFEDDSDEGSDMDSDGEYDDSDDSDDSDDGRTGAARFLKDVDSSDSEGSDIEERSKVKSAKDKRLDELEGIIRTIENAQKINDWAIIATEYDKLNRQITKLIEGGRAPKIYIRAIADLEDFMNEAVAKQKVTPKKMNATSAKSLNSVKQRIKKVNKEHQSQIDAYRADKDGFMEDSDAQPAALLVPKKASLVPVPEQVAEEDLSGFSQVGKGGKTVQFTPESIFKHLRTIMESRGKKNTDHLEQIRTMERLLEIANTPYQKIRVLLTIVSTRYDLASGSNPLPVEHWKAAEKELNLLLAMLDKHRDHIVFESAEEWDDDEKAPALAPGQKFIPIAGSLVSYVERLDDELTRSLQNIDPHTSEYIERLEDEGIMYNLIFATQLYYERITQEPDVDVPQESLNRLVIRRLEHVYFKPAQIIKIFEENSWKSVGDDVDSSIMPHKDVVEPRGLIQRVCGYLFANSEGIIRARAMLSQIYHLALHDEYYKARDMSLMSHLQETIPSFDVQTQILFNRTLVQLGLCAFRKGLVYDAQNTLQEICGSGRQKELLAQGVMMQRYQQVSPEQERLEKQRQLPFHMHINLELLECVYLTCSMLLEIPLLAQTGSSPDVKKRMISKSYRRLLEHHERQIFTGPPENTRDHVMQASKALAAGEWKKSAGFIHSIKIWDLIPNADEIKEMLSKQIQEEGLRTYLFTYAPFYNTLSVEMLSNMFELTPSRVAAVVGKMVSHEELSASIDQEAQTIVFRKGVELSRLQSLSLALADKASALIENNERALEQRTQGSTNAFDRQGNRGVRGGQRQGQRMGRGGARTGGHTQRQVGGTQFTGGALGVRG